MQGVVGPITCKYTLRILSDEVARFLKCKLVQIIFALPTADNHCHYPIFITLVAIVAVITNTCVAIVAVITHTCAAIVAVTTPTCAAIVVMITIRYAGGSSILFTGIPWSCWCLYR